MSGAQISHLTGRTEACEAALTALEAALTALETRMTARLAAVEAAAEAAAARSQALLAEANRTLAGFERQCTACIEAHAAAMMASFRADSAAHLDALKPELRAFMKEAVRSHTSTAAP